MRPLCAEGPLSELCVITVSTAGTTGPLESVMAHATPQQTAEAWDSFILRVALPATKGTSPAEAHPRSTWLFPVDL